MDLQGPAVFQHRPARLHSLGLLVDLGYGLLRESGVCAHCRVRSITRDHEDLLISRDLRSAMNGRACAVTGCHGVLLVVREVLYQLSYAPGSLPHVRSGQD
jgi:hypothetical protein